MKYMIFAIVVCLSGCVSYGNQIDKGYAQQLKKGVTTEQEVVANLGKPQTITINSNGNKILHYMYTTSSAKASSFIPIYGAFAGGATSETTMLTVTLDEQGVVSDWNYSESASDINTGLFAN